MRLPARKLKGIKKGSGPQIRFPQLPESNVTPLLVTSFIALEDLHGTRFNAIILHQQLMIRYRKREAPALLTEPCYSLLGSGIRDSAELTAYKAVTSESSQVMTLPGSETLVLLGVRLTRINTIPDTTSWAKWLHDNASDEVDSVIALCKRKVADAIGLQGIYKSTSMLVVITIPLCF